MEWTFSGEKEISGFIKNIYIFFQSHMCLKQHEHEYMMTEFSGEPSL